MVSTLMMMKSVDHRTPVAAKPPGHIACNRCCRPRKTLAALVGPSLPTILPASPWVVPKNHCRHREQNVALKVVVSETRQSRWHTKEEQATQQQQAVENKTPQERIVLIGMKSQKVHRK